MSDKGEWSDNEEVRGLDQSLLSLIATDSVAATYPTVKIKNIQVKKATKLTFYMENVTPVKGHFSVEASNYGPENDCLNHILVKAKTRTPGSSLKTILFYFINLFRVFLGKSMS